MVADSTLKWLNERAPKLDSKRPTVLFTHFPLGFIVPGRPRNADAVLEPFKDLNLQAVFNGHFHGLTERRRWNATLTTDKCCSFHHANHDGTRKGVLRLYGQGRKDRADVRRGEGALAGDWEGSGMPAAGDYFTQFGLDRRFEIDERALNARYERYWPRQTRAARGRGGGD